MEFLRCKNTFTLAQEILMTVDRIYYCKKCWCRLIASPNGKGGWRIEEDISGDKWRKVEKALG